MSRHAGKQGGYSLIELIVYLALFSALSITFIYSLLVSMKTYTAAQGYRSVQNNAELALERITREIRGASSISGTACPTGASTLSVSGTDASNTPYSVSFGFSNSAVTLSTNGGSATAVTTSEVVVNSATFCTYAAGDKTAVRTTLSLSPVRNTSTEYAFYSTTLPRE